MPFMCRLCTKPLGSGDTQVNHIATYTHCAHCAHCAHHNRYP
jgi:RNase P subunit RPR2